MLVLAGAVRGEPAPDDAAKKMLVVPTMETRPVEKSGQADPAAQAASSPADPKAAEAKETPTPPAGAATAQKEEAPEGPVPPSFPLARYAILWEKSPFQLESIAPPTESAGLAQRFVLVGIAQVDGEQLVYVRERATQQSFTVKKNAANAAGLLLVQVDERKEKLADASATIKLGAEQGTIKFDAPAAVAAVPQMGMPQQFRQGVPQPVRLPPQVPGMPGQPAPVPGQQVQAGAPGAPNPGQQVQQPGGQPAMPAPRVIRRRAIIPASP
ncbi:MAG: hypothetical protein WCI38_03540 [Chthoniobacterales bacterium]